MAYSCIAKVFCFGLKRMTIWSLGMTYGERYQSAQIASKFSIKERPCASKELMQMHFIVNKMNLHKNITNSDARWVSRARQSLIVR